MVSEVYEEGIGANEKGMHIIRGRRDGVMAVWREFETRARRTEGELRRASPSGLERSGLKGRRPKERPRGKTSLLLLTGTEEGILLSF